MSAGVDIALKVLADLALDYALTEIVDYQSQRVEEAMPEWGQMGQTALDYLTPDWLYQYSWQQPGSQLLTGPMGQRAGVAPGVGTGFFGTLVGQTPGARRDRYATAVVKITPEGEVVPVDVFKGKPLLTRKDIATVKRVKKCKAKLNRWFPSKRRKACKTRTVYRKK